MGVTINVRYFARLREMVGKREESFIFAEEPFVNDVLRKMSEKYGKSFDEFAFDDRHFLRKNLAVLVNGQGIASGQFQNFKLKNGDEFVLLPPTAGG
jgi:MoaD family protein